MQRWVMGRNPTSVRYSMWMKTRATTFTLTFRSRFVAGQISGPAEESVFAPTPPLETLRSMISMAAIDFPGRPSICRDPESEERMQESAVDNSRA